MGLSPRVRGNPRGVLSLGTPIGPIPACAGQPTSGQSRAASLWAYPRVCGATQTCLSFPCSFLGLSPRVRGNLPSGRRRSFIEGPIPACAGQPGHNLTLPAITWAYPRVCGATIERMIDRGEVQGLSPRVRGNRVGLAWMTQSIGPIPACAGQPWAQCACV